MIAALSAEEKAGIAAELAQAEARYLADRRYVAALHQRPRL